MKSEKSIPAKPINECVNLAKSKLLIIRQQLKGKSRVQRYRQLIREMPIPDPEISEHLMVQTIVAFLEILEGK